MRHIKIGDLEVPIEYFNLTKDEKDFLINEILNAMLILIDKSANPGINRMDILLQVIESSIETNEELEEFEICSVLSDIKKLINEERN